MITLICEHNPKPLGDTIDCLFLAHMISKIEDTKVNIKINHPDQALLNKFIGFADVVIGKPITKNVLFFNNSTRDGIRLYYSYSKQFKTIPKSTYSPNLNITLTDNLCTAQWDAQQIYRRPDKYDKNKLDEIETFYRSLGYDIVRVGGEGEYKTLDEIIYVMSKAKLHIGADSGCAHIAKFLMPSENIHLYHNITERKESRFPDGWNVPWMCREQLRRGARLNFSLDNNDEDRFNNLNAFI